MKIRLFHILIIISLFVSTNLCASSEHGAINCFNRLSKLIKKQHIPFNEERNLLELDSLLQIESKLGDANLIHYRKMRSDSGIIEINELTFKLLSKETLLQRAVNEKGLSISTIKEIFESLTRSSRLSERGVSDAKCDRFGFCFGRASMVHFEALSKSIPSDLIKKVWMIGKVKSWRYHVATILRSGSDWYVLDTDSGLMKIDNWVAKYNKQNLIEGRNRPLMYIVTEASRESYFDSSSYKSKNFFSDQFEGYFYRFFEDLRQRIEKK